MTKTRLEAFSDGVLAIAITIMVLELKTPHGVDIRSLRPLVPILLSYVLSFVYIGIYWNNHHHLLQATHWVSASTLWANLHLLFWLSLIPFATGWLGETGFASAPLGLYGIILLMSAFSWWVLQRTLVRTHGADSELARAFSHDRKGIVSLLCYAVAIPAAFYQRWVAGLLYVAGSRPSH
jgi:uncharacterized membrane protein